MLCHFLAVMLDCGIVGMSWPVPTNIFSLNKCRSRQQKLKLVGQECGEAPDFTLQDL